MEKEPEGRFQSARDLAFDLESLSEGSMASAASKEAVRGGKKREVWILAGVAAFAIAAAAAAIGVGVLSNKPVALKWQRLTYQKGMVQSARGSHKTVNAWRIARRGEEIHAEIFLFRRFKSVGTKNRTCVDGPAAYRFVYGGRTEIAMNCGKLTKPN